MTLSKNINPSLVLVQPRKNCPFITERLLMGRKESNQQIHHFYTTSAYEQARENHRCSCTQIMDVDEDSDLSF